ncbi:MAG: hypothetical protein PHW50_03150, partial [Patescibacteria group bacterium]|nr:hypothetical protein [Patescibacteria group bacterium]
MKDIIPPDSFKPKYKKEKKSFFSFLKRKKNKKEIATTSPRNDKYDKKTKKVNFDLDLARVSKKINPPIKVKKNTAFKLKSRLKRNNFKKSKPIPWTGLVIAFLFALLIVMMYFMRDRIPYKDYLNYILKWKSNISATLDQPVQINFLPSGESELTTLGYYARQKKEKVEILSVDSEGQERILYSFIANDLSDHSIALSDNYVAFIDREGLKFHSFKTKQTDLIMANTQIAKLQKVYIDPSEKFVAFFILQKNEYRLFLYSVKDNQVRERNFLADNLIFGAKSNLYFSNGQSFYLYDYVKNTDERKITDFDAPIIAFYKTNDVLLLINGARKKISLWQINELSATATKLTDFNLTFDYTLDDFGVAKKENTLYISLAGKTLIVDTKTKQKKDITLNMEIYKLLDFEEEEQLFFAFK